MTTQQTPFETHYWAAFLADAASLGLHWIYDIERLDKVVKAHNNQAVFLPVDKSHYQGEVGYFAHGHKRSGMLTQYGESLRLMIDSMNACDGEFNIESVQQHFKDTFGPGGSYQGYIDKPTAGTWCSVLNI